MTASVSNSVKNPRFWGFHPVSVLPDLSGKLAAHPLPSLEEEATIGADFSILEVFGARSSAQSTYDEWRNEWMGPTQPGSDWAFCKNEQEGPKVIIILFQIQPAWSFFSCKIKTKQDQTKTLSWGITLSFPSLSHLQSTPLGQLAREGAQGSWPFPLGPT